MKIQKSFKKILLATLIISNASTATQPENKEIVSQVRKQIEEKVNLMKQPTKNNPVQGDPAKDLQKVQQDLIKRSLRGGTGVDGGGGNARPSDPIAKNDIENFVRAHLTKVAIKMRFNEASNFKGLGLFKTDPYNFSCTPMPTCFDEYFKDYHHLVSANLKLFYSNSGRSIFDAIDTARVYVQDASCLDPHTGKEADASASISQNAICLSYDRLSKKLNKSDIEDRLLVLLMHEYSHLLGTTEKEALVIEDKLRDWYQDYNKFSQALCSYQHSYTALFKSLWDMTTELQKNFSNSISNQICTRLVKIYEKTQQVQDDINVQMLDDLELSVYNIFDFSPQLHVTAKSLNNIMYCKSTSLGYIIDDVQKDFGDDEVFELWKNLFKNDEQIITMKDAVKRLSFETEDPAEYLETLTGNIRNVSTGNMENVKLEVDEFLNALNHLRHRYKALFGVDPALESSKCQQ